LVVSCLYLACFGKPGRPTQARVANAYVLTQAAQSNGAVCLDGTPSVYYYRPGATGGLTKWYIHHEGGGWCEGVADCYGRSQGGLGSSKDYPKTTDLGGGYFSEDPNVNPQMWNWNAVYLKYCDGGSFSGNNETVTTYNGHNLYFRGFRILQAMLADLLSSRGLSKATDVVISGCSAGGLSTFLHVDWWRQHLPQGAHVVGMPDSGFFLDYEAPAKRYHSGMIWVFDQMNATSGVNQACIQAHEATQDTWKCFFAQWTSPHITTPTFPLQSVYDSWQTSEDLNSSDQIVINEWGRNLTDLVKTLFLTQPQHGIFLDSCFHHCGNWGSIRINGLVQATAFQQWYNGQGATKFYNQNEVYPCEACCKA